MNDASIRLDDDGRAPYQFRLRTLLLVVAVLGVTLSLIAVKVNQYQSQRRAATELQKFGATVGWSWSGNVTSVAAVGSKITDEDLKPLAKLPHLEALHIGATPITDAAVKHLKELRSLKHLSVSETNMSPRGVAVLRRELSQTEIVDIGIGKPTGQTNREWIVTGDE